MNNKLLLLLIPVLLGCGGNQDNLKKQTSTIHVTNQVTNEKYGGIGFHIIFHTQ